LKRMHIRKRKEEHVGNATRPVLTVAFSGSTGPVHTTGKVRMMFSYS